MVFRKIKDSSCFEKVDVDERDCPMEVREDLE